MDNLDRIVAIVIRVAEREGLLDARDDDEEIPDLSAPDKPPSQTDDGGIPKR